MKNFVISTIIFLSSSLCLAGVVNGFIVVENQRHWLIDKDSSEPLELKPSTMAVQETLDKLNTFDRLRGQANVSSDSSLVLETIDFVTLRKLIGTWVDSSNKVQITFIDHSNLSIKKETQDDTYTYSLSPGNAQSWRMFLGDGTKVLLGSLLLDEDKIKFEILDSATGQVMESHNLTRKPVVK